MMPMEVNGVAVKEVQLNGVTVCAESVPVPFTTETITASGNWTCPEGVFYVTGWLQGGGAGGFWTTFGAAQGGLAGGVARISLAVVPGTVYPIVCGAGGPGIKAPGTAPETNGQPTTMFGLSAAGGVGGSAGFAVNDPLPNAYTERGANSATYYVVGAKSGTGYPGTPSMFANGAANNGNTPTNGTLGSGGAGLHSADGANTPGSGGTGVAYLEYGAS